MNTLDCGLAMSFGMLPARYILLSHPPSRHGATPRCSVVTSLKCILIRMCIFFSDKNDEIVWTSAAMAAAGNFAPYRYPYPPLKGYGATSAPGRDSSAAHGWRGRSGRRRVGVGKKREEYNYHPHLILWKLAVCCLRLIRPCT